MPSRQKTLDQKRAKQAWEDVQEAKQRSPEFRKKYGSLARRVPMLVLTNGLGQTLAFLFSKAKPHEKNRGAEAQASDVLFKHLSRWTLSQVDPNFDGTLLSWVIQTNSTAYRRATIEALAYLGWLKRFAEAELPTEEEEG